MRQCFGRVLWGLLGSALMAGCTQTQTYTVGQTDVQAVWSLGNLSVDVAPVRGGTATLVAAAEAALAGRGYVQRWRASTSTDPVVVRARRAGAGLDEATVSLHAGVRSTTIEVRVGVFGNQDESREILSDMLGRLGY
ncbi:MAG: hypothetical protein JNJ48_04705 [Phycisphaerae bacterium]|nr:hypothetical protein [Phycisphaerae bacterium]